MEALFIGHAYIDVTFLTDTLPTGDDKTIADDYAVSFGGNAVTAAFAAAKMGVRPDLLCTLADDWLSLMFREMARSARVRLHDRKVSEASLSFIMPKDGKRAIVRCRDDNYLHPYPSLNLDGCKVLHVDGHQPDAALHYAKACREKGIATSLDGGAVRENTDELLNYIDVAVVSERFCEQWGLSAEDSLEKLKNLWLPRGRGDTGRGWRGVLCARWRAASCQSAARPGQESHRHQRRRRHLPRRLYRFHVAVPKPDLGGAFPLRARGVGLCDPASWQ